MKRLTLQKSWFVAAALAVVLCACALPQASAQDQPPPQGVSRGENFSAKPPAQLFASDCTGAGCHKGPQGLAKGGGIGGLTGFLREHYTNSRESAAALAAYLSKIPNAPEPKETRASARGKPAEVAPTSSSPGWAEGFGFPPSREKEKEKASAKPNEPRGSRESQKPGRATRSASRPEPAAKPEVTTHHPAAAKPEEEPAAAPPAATASAPAAHETPEARAPRRQQPTAAAAVPMPPTPTPAAEAAPAPAPAAPKHYDIFD